jgi:hypothetical protein
MVPTGYSYLKWFQCVQVIGTGKNKHVCSLLCLFIGVKYKVIRAMNTLIITSRERMEGVDV